MRRINRACLLLAEIFVAGLLFASTGNALNLADFRTCIGSSGTGQTCQLDQGYFLISSTLTIGRGNLTIEGAGRSLTVLQRADNFTGPLFYCWEELSYITIQDMTLNLYAADATGAADDVSLKYVSWFTIRNVDFPHTEGNSSINFAEGCNYVTVSSCNFLHPHVCGILVNQGEHYGVHIEQCVIENARANAINIDSTEVVEINDNLIRNNHTYGFDGQTGGGQIDVQNCSYVDIYDNTFYQDQNSEQQYTPVHGIEMWASNTVHIYGNEIYDHSASGIWVYGGEIIGIFDNNQIYDNNTWNIEHPGIYIWNATNIWIDANNIHDSSYWGIITYGCTSPIVVTNNTFSNNYPGNWWNY